MHPASFAHGGHWLQPTIISQGTLAVLGMLHLHTVLATGAVRRETAEKSPVDESSVSARLTTDTILANKSSHGEDRNCHWMEYYMEGTCTECGPGGALRRT